MTASLRLVKYALAVMRSGIETGRAIVFDPGFSVSTIWRMSGGGFSKNQHKSPKSPIKKIVVAERQNATLFFRLRSAAWNCFRALSTEMRLASVFRLSSSLADSSTVVRMLARASETAASKPRLASSIFLMTCALASEPAASTSASAAALF
jgi:hypothetical protein